MNWDADNPLDIAADEPSKCNQALNDYAALGVTRSLSKLAEQYRTTAKSVPIPTRQLTRIKEWSSAYDWQERCAAYDEQLRRRLREQREAIWLERREKSREQTWESAQQLRKRLADMQQFPLATVERETARRQSADGTQLIIEQTIIKPAKWTMSDAAKIADTAAKLERLAAELETERHVISIEGLTARDLEAMPTEQLLALRAQLDKGSQ